MERKAIRGERVSLAEQKRLVGPDVTNRRSRSVAAFDVIGRLYPSERRNYCWAHDVFDVATHCKGTASKTRPRGWCHLCALCRCNSMCAFVTSDHNFLRPAICLFVEVDPLFRLQHGSHCLILISCAIMVCRRLAWVCDTIVRPMIHLKFEITMQILFCKRVTACS